MYGARMVDREAEQSRDVKTAILEAAETVFAVYGFHGATTRAIAEEADVNLAMIHYHFGSKEVLFQAVLTRRLDPMNQQRLELLTRFEGEAAPKPLGCDRILTALLIPALKLARDPKRGGSNFLRLLGRAYADPAPFIRQFLSEQYAVMIGRFKAAFSRALPNMPSKELSWRLHFIMGALSYTLAGTDALKLIAELNPHETTNDELLLRRLGPFLLAGLTAPLPDLRAVTRELEDEPAPRRH